MYYFCGETQALGKRPHGKSPDAFFALLFRYRVQVSLLLLGLFPSQPLVMFLDMFNEAISVASRTREAKGCLTFVTIMPGADVHLGWLGVGAPSAPLASLFADFSVKLTHRVMLPRR